MSQLRGHWEDTSGKVQARKNTLEELAAANRHFEIKQQEIEAWLGRMESWQTRLRPVGATQDILEQQSREVKVMKNGYWVFLNILFLFHPNENQLVFHQVSFIFAL